MSNKNHFVEIIETIRKVEATNVKGSFDKWDTFFVRSILCFIAFAIALFLVNHLGMKSLAQFLAVPLVTLYLLLVVYTSFYLGRVIYKGLTSVPSNHSLLNRAIHQGPPLKEYVLALLPYSNAELLSFADWVEYRVKAESKLAALAGVVLVSPLILDTKKLLAFEIPQFSPISTGVLIAILLLFVFGIRFLSVYWEKYQFYATYTANYRDLYADETVSE